MLCKKIIEQYLNISGQVRLTSKLLKNQARTFNLSAASSEKNNTKALVVPGLFDRIENKNKSSYLEVIEMFNNFDKHRRGHVEFIYAALKNMESFNVNRDLEVYKALINVLPKGKFIPQNFIQAEFMHYPKQQQCIIDLLEQMEDNSVMPDEEMEDMLLNTFGNRGHPVRKFWRMMYWMPKFKNLSPWPLPDPIPDSVFELAKLAMARINSVDMQAQLAIYNSADIQDSIEDTWIISCQSPTQKRLLESHNQKEPVYVEGAFRVWIKSKPVNYFILRAAANPVIDDIEDTDDVSRIKVPFFTTKPPKKNVAVMKEIHEQNDGTILASCATGTSSKDSLLSWIRHLEKDGNPTLGVIPIVFTLQSASNELANIVSKIDQIEDR